MELINKLAFSSNIYLYLLIFLFLPLIIFYNSKIFTRKNYNLEFLSKPTTNCVKGLCILIIIFHHVSLTMRNPALIKPFTLVGYLAVSLFFFLSGYGLMFSFLNKDNYLSNFFSKRLSKVYLPFVVVNALTLIAIYFSSNTKYSVADIILYILGIKLIDSALWFVKSIILFYIVFYIAFKFFKKDTGCFLLVIYSIIYSIVCYSLSLSSWWFNAVLCFPIGIYMATYYTKIICFIQKSYIKIFLLSGFLFVVSFLLANLLKSPIKIILSTSSTIFFVVFVLTILLKFKIYSKPLNSIGNLSYEMYLVHMKVLIFYFNNVKIKESYSIYIYLFLVIFLSFLINRIFANIFTKKPVFLVKQYFSK